MNALQLLLIVALVLLIIVTIVALANYSGKGKELDEAADKLENAIAETLSIVTTFASRVLAQMRRLLAAVKQWFLDWIQAFSRETGVVLEYFSKGIQWWVSNIWVQMQRIQTFALSLANQIQKIMIDLVFQIQSKGMTLLAKLMSEMIVRTVSGVLWISNKLFCTFVGIGRSLATFFTETVRDQLSIFYSRYIYPYVVQPFLTAWSYIQSDAFWQSIKKWLEDNAKRIFVDPIVKFVDDLF